MSGRLFFLKKTFLVGLTLLFVNFSWASVEEGKANELATTAALTVDYVYHDGSWLPSNPDGVSTIVDNITIVNGEVTLESIVNVYNLNINAGATLNIKGILNLYGSLDIKGNLIFRSGPGYTGELGHVEPLASITGEATVEQYFQNKRAYRMVSPTVTTTTSIHDNWQEGATSNTHNPFPNYGTHITGTTIDQTDGFDATQSGAASMFTVNVASQQFEPIANTDVKTLQAGRAYLMYIRGDRSVDLTDNTSSSATTLRAKGALRRGTALQMFNSTTAGQFVMIGNPYQSCVDMATLLAEAENLNPSFYYVFDPTINTHGGYVTVFLPSGTNLLGSSAGRYLQPGQGAQVQVVNDGISGVAFSEYHKAAGNLTSGSVGSKSLSDENMITVQLYTADKFANGGSVQDGVGILFSEDHDNAIDLYDAKKLMNFGDNLARNHDGNYLSIEHRNLPQTGEILHLYTADYSGTDYVFKVIVDGLQKSTLYLVDSYTGNKTLLAAGENTYAFQVTQDESSKVSDRFSIEVEKSLLNNNEVTSLENLTIYPNPVSDDYIYLSTPQLSAHELNIRISDMVGRQIQSKSYTVSGNSLKVDFQENLPKGIYLMTVESAIGNQTFRFIKK